MDTIMERTSKLELSKSDTLSNRVITCLDRGNMITFTTLSLSTTAYLYSFTYLNFTLRTVKRSVLIAISVICWTQSDAANHNILYIHYL
jgi:hypothetical protein